MSDNATPLLALALVERCLLEDQEGITALAQVTSQEELGQLATALAIILAGHLEATHGITGGIETVDRWRNLYIDGAADE